MANTIHKADKPSKSTAERLCDGLDVVRLMANAKAADKPSISTTSTTQEFKLFTIDADDLIVMRIDKKDPARKAIFEAIGKIFEAEHRDAEHSAARAYAQMAP